MSKNQAEKEYFAITATVHGCHSEKFSLWLRTVDAVFDVKKDTIGRHYADGRSSGYSLAYKMCRAMVRSYSLVADITLKEAADKLAAARKESRIVWEVNGLTFAEIQAIDTAIKWACIDAAKSS